MIKISPFTPLFFSPSSDKFGAESRYIQLFAPADNIFIEVITTTEYKINGLLKNHVDGTSREIEFQSFSLKDGSTVFHSTITGLASGYYSISVGDQECNVFKVTDDEHELGKTTLIRYSMRSNKQRNDCIFWNGEEQFYFEFRAPGGFKDDDWTFAVNNEQFEISNGNIVELFAVESTQKKFTLGNAEGCPVWFAEHLNRILCCSNVYFNGVRFVRKGNSVPEMTQEIVSLKSYIFKVSLQGMVDNIDVDFPEGGEEEGGETGGGGEGYIYLIKLNDTVVPTDRNTFSSLRLLAEIDKAISANNILFIDTFLRKDQPDSTDHLTGFNAGITIGESKKQLLDIIRLSDLDISPSDTSVYTSLSVDTIITALEDKYIRKDKEDSTLYPVDFRNGLLINSKRIGDIIRYYDEDKPVATDANIYSALQTDQRIEDELNPLEDKYIRKDQPDSTLYPVDFTAGLSINSKRIGDVIRYYDENKPVATDANIYSALQTDQRIDEEFGKIDDRYIRKDKEDIAHKHITFEDGITVYQLAEMMNVDVKNLATIAKAVVSILRSSKFVDGFSGEGYQIWQDIATGDWNMTLDRLTVRKVLTIYELVLQKIRSVGGMVVVSAANGKVKSVERIGNNYLFTFEDTNQFQPDDFMRCQVFSPSGLKYYWVKVASVSGESVIVPLSEFDGVIPASGDEVVLMGNATDKRRQSLILISATEDGQPRFDCLDGVKSKNLEGCLKVRVGSLDGISDSRFPADMQPSGYGLYGNNCFLTGIFVLSNGKDVMTMFSIMEGMIKSEISSVRNEINAKDNYLSNASFSGDLMDWSSTNRVRVFRVDNRLLSFNNNFYANKENLASITLEDGRSVLRLKNSSITQYNSNFARYPKFDEKIKYEEVEVPVLDADGNPVLDESGQPVTELQEVPVLDGEGNTVMIKIPRQFYISFNYMVKRTGTLTVYFKNESSDESGNSYKEEFESYDPIYFVKSLLPTSGFQKMEIAGKWNGKGHFYLAFTGDMYLYSLALADNPLAEMEEKFTMRFEATDKKIQANLDEIKKTGTRLEEYHSEFLLTARNLQTKFTADLTDMEAGITAAYKSYVNLTAQNLEAGFTEDLTDLRTGVTEAYKAAIDLSARGLRADFNSSIADLNGKLTTHTSSFHVTASKIEAMVSATDNISNTIKTAGWITTADGNKLWATISTVDELGNKLTTHTGSFHVTASKIEAMVSATDSISNTIRTAGWITTADGNKLWATISTVDALGNRLTSHEGKFHVSATEISGIVTRIDATESSISGINKTISSSGWITTADGNKLWSTLTQYNALNQVVSTHTGSFHVTATKINSMVESIDDTGRKYSAITQTVGEIRADVNDVSGKYANLSLKVDAISAVVGDGSTGSFSEFLQTVNEISASVTEVKNGLDTHKGSFHITADKIEAMVTATDNISNTIKTAGWITKSDGNTWWASKGTEQTASDAAKSAINAATAAADAMTKANSAYDKADDTATALVQTNSSLSAIAGRFNADGTLKEGAGWVTTADAAALYATKQTVNSLGERVTTAESRITANADSISLTVKKDGIISAINQTAESVTIDASKINLNGAITANGYFKINLDGSMEASAGTIAGLKISGESLTNEGFNNDAYIILRNDTHNTFAGIGGNTLPVTSGIRAVARFSNEESGGFWGNTNVAMMVSAKNATWNRAIVATGDILTNGLNIGYSFHEYSFTANNQWQKPSVLKSDILYVYFNYSNCAFVLPTLRDVCESLGISYSTPFAIRLTVISSSGDGKLYGRNKTIAGTSGNEYPELMSWTGGIDTSGYNVSSHDSFEVCLFYNGGSSYIPSNEGAYRAYITGALR